MAPTTESHKQVTNGEKKPPVKKAEEEDEDALTLATQITGSIVIPLALRSAIEVGVFDILAKAGEGAELSTKDIAVQIGSNNPEAPTMLDRLLSLLTTHSLLHCSVSQHSERLYSLSKGSKYFVTGADGVSLGPTLALLLDNVFYQSWSVLVLIHYLVSSINVCFCVYLTSLIE